MSACCSRSKSMDRLPTPVSESRLACCLRSRSDSWARARSVACSIASAVDTAKPSRARQVAGLGRRPSAGRSTERMPTRAPSDPTSGANSASSGCQASSASTGSTSGIQVIRSRWADSLRWSANRSRPHGSLAASRASHTSALSVEPSSIARAPWSPATEATSNVPSGWAMLMTATPKPRADTMVCVSRSSIDTRSSETVGPSSGTGASGACARAPSRSCIMRLPPSTICFSSPSVGRRPLGVSVLSRARCRSGGPERGLPPRSEGTLDRCAPPLAPPYASRRHR